MATSAYEAELALFTPPSSSANAWTDTTNTTYTVGTAGEEGFLSIVCCLMFELGRSHRANRVSLRRSPSTSTTYSTPP